MLAWRKNTQAKRHYDDSQDRTEETTHSVRKAQVVQRICVPYLHACAESAQNFKYLTPGSASLANVNVAPIERAKISRTQRQIVWSLTKYLVWVTRQADVLWTVEYVSCALFNVCILRTSRIQRSAWMLAGLERLCNRVKRKSCSLSSSSCSGKTNSFMPYSNGMFPGCGLNLLS